MRPREIGPVLLRRTRYRGSMIGTARFFVISSGVVAAAVLLWVSTRPDETAVAGYAITTVLLAAAGATLGFVIVLASTLSTAVARSLRGAVAGGVLLIAPVALAGIWVVLANAPSGRVANEIRSWSDSIGVLAVVDDLELTTPTIAFAVGLLLASLLALIGADRRRAAAQAAAAEPEYEPSGYVADREAAIPAAPGPLVEETAVRDAPGDDDIPPRA